MTHSCWWIKLLENRLAAPLGTHLEALRIKILLRNNRPLLQNGFKCGISLVACPNLFVLKNWEVRSCQRFNVQFWSALTVCFFMRFFPRSYQKCCKVGFPLNKACPGADFKIHRLWLSSSPCFLKSSGNAQARACSAFWVGALRLRDMTLLWQHYSNIY